MNRVELAAARHTPDAGRVLEPLKLVKSVNPISCAAAAAEAATAVLRGINQYVFGARGAHAALAAGGDVGRVGFVPKNRHDKRIDTDDTLSVSALLGRSAILA